VMAHTENITNWKPRGPSFFFLCALRNGVYQLWWTVERDF
jgi:hypothetical protein